MRARTTRKEGQDEASAQVLTSNPESDHTKKRGERKPKRHSSGSTLLLVVACLFILMLFSQSRLSKNGPKGVRTKSKMSARGQGTPRTPTQGQSKLRTLDQDESKSRTLEQDESKSRTSPQKGQPAVVDITKLPKWVRDYFAFHAETRRKFPGKELFTNPAAPKALVRTCLGLCGGLNDRLGQLPLDLYVANTTGRILLVHWSRPHPLESFLVPNLINWTVPEGVGFDDPSREGMRPIRALPTFPMSYGEGSEDLKRPFGEKLDEAIDKVTNGDLKEERILTMNFLGHLNEQITEERLLALGESDMIHKTPTFGRIFWSFFHPSPGVLEEVNKIRSELNLIPGRYSAVHCRVRHPQGVKNGEDVPGKEGDNADKYGLPWEGDTRTAAVKIATHAIKCAATKSKNNDEPLYFYADTNHLVDFMAHELKSSDKKSYNDTVDIDAKTAVDPLQIKSRETSLENVHIDRQKGRKVHEYYGTFIDLIIGADARCMTYGIGFYARFAAKISGTQCKLRHRKETWGKTILDDPLCTPDFYK